MLRGMSKDNEETAPGSFWDWPTKWILIGIAMIGLGVLSFGPAFVALGWVAIAFGGISTAIRRGAFTPRGD